ncbi:hypothetical protein RRG08_020833 [Elysia crispata]|uniref:Uncharacterized protein n=1 Tax=Elysia crispata TaxID=231223 RepID=A0AAE1CMT6_9GAST|nr:hypothetical protein RRG08_020833 [Elysia crispata]
MRHHGQNSSGKTAFSDQSERDWTLKKTSPLVESLTEAGARKSLYTVPGYRVACLCNVTLHSLSLEREAEDVSTQRFSQGNRVSKYRRSSRSRHGATTVSSRAR